MKRIEGWMLAAIGIVLAGTIANIAWAQGGGPHPVATPAVRTTPVAPAAPGAVAPGSGEKKVMIRHMPRLSKVKQYTPQYTTTATKSTATRQREWGVFDVTYDTLPEWMDEVVVTFYLMAERRSSDSKKEYSFYQTTVRYTDVARGEHTACVVLPPAALLRNGDQFLGFAVEITSPDNTLLAVQNELSGSLLPSDWWKNAKITDDKSVIKRDGLVDRSKTPFGLINIDDYEVVK